jgi:FAD/FMN-containing dehydrogenase
VAVRRTRAPRNPAAPEAPVDRNSFALGERVPERVAQPATVEELAATLRACDEAGEAVVLFGGGTLQGLGSAPARYDVAVSPHTSRTT